MRGTIPTFAPGLLHGGARSGGLGGGGRSVSGRRRGTRPPRIAYHPPNEPERFRLVLNRYGMYWNANTGISTINASDTGSATTPV